MPSTSVKKSILVIDLDGGQVHRIMPSGEFRKNVGTKDTTGYLRINVCGKAKHVHHIIAQKLFGSIPAGYDIDHINQNKLDNRAENLRIVSRSQNMQNTSAARPNSSSGVKGVSFCRLTKKWRAQITHNYKSRYLGTFERKDLAAEFYALAALMLHTHNPVAFEG